MRDEQIKYDHFWGERLQALRLCEPVLKELLRLWPVGELADCILEQSDSGPFSGLKRLTICTFLNALKKNPRERGERERTPHAIALTRRMKELFRDIKVDENPIDVQERTGGPVSKPQPSEIQKEIAAMTDVDRRLMLEAIEKYKILQKRVVQEAKEDLRDSIIRQCHRDT